MPSGRVSIFTISDFGIGYGINFCNFGIGIRNGIARFLQETWIRP